MKIDKTRFLLLTGAIATATLLGVGAAGCSSTDAPGDPPTDTDGGTTPETDSGDTTPETDGGDGDGNGNDASTPTDAGTDAADETPACLDEDTGPAPDCEGGPALAANCADACIQLTRASSNRFLKNSVGREVVDCLAQLTTCHEESGDLTEEALDCQREAVAKACVTTAEKDTCSALVAVCGTAKLTQAQCEQTVGASNDYDFAGCITEGSSSADYCISDAKGCVLESLR